MVNSEPIKHYEGKKMHILSSTKDILQNWTVCIMYRISSSNVVYANSFAWLWLSCRDVEIYTSQNPYIESWQPYNKTRASRVDPYDAELIATADVGRQRRFVLYTDASKPNHGYLHNNAPNLMHT